MTQGNRDGNSEATGTPLDSLLKSGGELLGTAVAAERNGGISTNSIEKATLARLNTPDAVHQAELQGLHAGVFEDPLHRRVYSFVVDYWRSENQMRAPSASVLETEFPEFRIEPTEGESLTWMIRKLQDRYKTNQIQASLRDVAKLSFDDPTTALDRMVRDGGRIKEVAGLEDDQGLPSDAGFWGRVYEIEREELARREGRRRAQLSGTEDQDFEAEFLDADELDDIQDIAWLIDGVLPEEVYGVLVGRDYTF